MTTTDPSNNDICIREIDPTRLASGQWDHERDVMIGEGDVVASYSADRIGQGRPVRKPFLLDGALWICTSLRGRHDHLSAEVYRLVLPGAFHDPVATYGEKTAIDDGDYARNDPKGFYHGMTITHAGQTMILSGPKLELIPAQEPVPGTQLSLFAGDSAS